MIRSFLILVFACLFFSSCDTGSYEKKHSKEIDDEKAFRKAAKDAGNRWHAKNSEFQVHTIITGNDYQSLRKRNVPVFEFTIHDKIILSNQTADALAVDLLREVDTSALFKLSDGKGKPLCAFIWRQTNSKLKREYDQQWVRNLLTTDKYCHSLMTKSVQQSDTIAWQCQVLIREIFQCPISEIKLNTIICPSSPVLNIPDMQCEYIITCRSGKKLSLRIDRANGHDNIAVFPF